MKSLQKLNFLEIQIRKWLGKPESKSWELLLLHELTFICQSDRKPLQMKFWLFATNHNINLHLPLFDCLVEKLVHIRWEFLLHRLSGRLLYKPSKLKVAFFQKVRFVFQTSKSLKKIILNHYPELEIWNSCP